MSPADTASKRRALHQDVSVKNVPDPRLTALWEELWGNGSPEFHDTITRAELAAPKPTDGLSGHAGDLDSLDSLDYRYFDNVARFSKLLGGPYMVNSLVVRKEYDVLLGAFETIHRRSILITGQPGIGKTAFLIYILLKRLKEKLPTAIQLSSSFFVIFDDDGAKVCSTVSLTDPSTKLALEKCWSLIDNNHGVSRPCDPLQDESQRVIYASSPQPTSWRQWVKQVAAQIVVMDLPNLLEIAAIVKAQGFDTTSSAALVHRWGPSVRTILYLHLRNTSLDGLENNARNAAAALASDPSTVVSQSDLIGLPIGTGSSLCFVRPVRRNDTSKWSSSFCFIPTDFLWSLFEKEYANQDLQKKLILYRALDMHSVTRTAAGWAFEGVVHRRMCNSTDSPQIFRAHQATMYMPILSRNIIPGTLAGLGQTGPTDAFYWLPCNSNIPGVDSVLGTADGSLFAIQATIAGQHESPLEGITKIRECLREDALRKRRWFFLLVTDNQQAALQYLAEYGDVITPKVQASSERTFEVEVWACIIKP